MSRECPECFGKGLADQDDRPGLLLPADECPRCRGRGEIDGRDETEPVVERLADERGEAQEDTR